MTKRRVALSAITAAYRITARKNQVVLIVRGLNPIRDMAYRITDHPQAGCVANADRQTVPLIYERRSSEQMGRKAGDR